MASPPWHLAGGGGGGTCGAGSWRQRFAAASSSAAACQRFEVSLRSHVRSTVARHAVMLLPMIPPLPRSKRGASIAVHRCRRGMKAAGSGTGGDTPAALTIAAAAAAAAAARRQQRQWLASRRLRLRRRQWTQAAPAAAAAAWKSEESTWGTWKCCGSCHGAPAASQSLRVMWLPRCRVPAPTHGHGFARQVTPNVTHDGDALLPRLQYQTAASGIPCSLGLLPHPHVPPCSSSAAATCCPRAAAASGGGAWGRRWRC